MTIPDTFPGEWCSEPTGERDTIRLVMVYRRFGRTRRAVFDARYSEAVLLLSAWGDRSLDTIRFSDRVVKARQIRSLGVLPS